jgi:glc operon protein GlcG
MRKLVWTALTLCAAVSAGALAQAQTPMQSPPPTAAPQASPPQAPPPYGLPITVEQARKAAQAAAEEAKKNNWFMAIAIVAPSGDLVYFEKMDNTQYASVAISQHKARAAATFRRPTLAFEENLAKGAAFTYQLTLDGMIGSQGGNPIVMDGKVIGAIGVSGGTGPQDNQVSMAGLNALK